MVSQFGIGLEAAANGSKTTMESKVSLEASG